MWNDRADVSRQRRELIESRLRDTYHQAHGADSGQDLKKANEMLQEVLEMMKDKSSRMLREDHDACWERWLEIKETIKYRREAICDFNYRKFKGEAYEAQGLAEEFPKDAKQKVRDVQLAMKGRTMARLQFDEINQILDVAFNIASGVLRRRHEEWERKHHEWRSRMAEAKSRKLQLLEKNRDTVYNLERQIDHCRDMLRNARSSDYESRVEGWIDEKYEKIRDIERFNSELHDQIRDIDAKLGE